MPNYRGGAGHGNAVRHRRARRHGHGRVGRRHGGDRRRGRARHRRPGPARHRRVEPGRLPHRVGGHADRPVRGRGDGSRRQRLGDDGRDQRHADVRGRARRQRPWDGPGPHHAAIGSPISYASRRTTPLLILHGEEDARVPLSQAVAVPPRAARPGGAGRAGDLPARAARHRRAAPPGGPDAPGAGVVRPLAALTAQSSVRSRTG